MGRQAGVSLTARAAERLHAHTGGHPLYVRTLLREVPQARLIASDGELPVPRSLEATIVARLAELPAEARRLAEALSVIGEPVPLSVAGRVGGVGRPAEALDDLLATGWVTWTPDDPQAPVAFGHPLYRAALYRDLSPARRRSLHAAAAQMLDAGSSLAHRVAAADGVDDSLAAELADTGRAGRAQGGSHPRRPLPVMGVNLGIRPSHGRGASPRRGPPVDRRRAGLPGDRAARPAGTLRGEPAAKPGAGHAGVGARRERPGRAMAARSGLRSRYRRSADDPVALAALTQLGAIYCTHGRAAQAIEAGRLALSLRPG